MKIIYSDKYLKYDFGSGHPFSVKIRKEFVDLITDEYRGKYDIIKPLKADDMDILTVHAKDYLLRLKKIASGGGGFLSMDTPVNKNILEAAYYYVGGTIKASEIALKEGIALNTLGGLHHAESNNSSGFCVFNDHAIAIRKLQKQKKINKAAILDLDVHAGNGTQEIFYEDPSVLTISIHQDPKVFYPGTGFSWQTGEGEGEGFNINYPLPLETTEAEYLPVLEKAIKKIEKFDPCILFVVFGVDTYKNDRLGGFRLEKETYAKITLRFVSLARGKHNKLPIVILFAGGYSNEVPGIWREIVNAIL